LAVVQQLEPYQKTRMIDRVSPKRLYKYRSFSNLTLGMLVEDTIFYADPTTFNDPLDTKPTLDADIENAALEATLTQLIEERTRAELSAAAKTIRYNGPRTMDHITRQSRKAADQLLADIRYYATDPEYEVEDPEHFLLAYHVEKELLRRYDRGVFSLAERANCPLMWSHYGDQHRGICLGYSVPDDVVADLHKIKYGGSRLVQASQVSAMLGGDQAASRRVDEAVLLKKAKPWAYEREWRLLGPRGSQDSPLELEEIVFGMRCSSAVMYAVIKALDGRDRAVRFYEIRGQHGRFLLDKRVADTDELLATLPRRHRRIHETFREFEDLDSVASRAEK
jgi:hypothetical protein